MDGDGRSGEIRRLADELARRAKELGLMIGVAESLTSGRIAAAIGASEGASEWFCGGVVAYVDDVKFRVLGVRRGPVISDECAREMADGAKRLLGADVALGVTGVGGPGEAEGKPAGTVFIATSYGGRTEGEEHHFSGSPDDVLEKTIAKSIDLVLRTVPAPASARPIPLREPGGMTG